MDLLLILTYAAAAYAVFKIFKIPVTAYSLLTAALGGIALIGALLLGMGYNHPFTKEGRFYFSSTPILPDVSGRVIAVEARPHEPLKAGDVLFRIDPVPYEKAVAAARARLEQEKTNLLQRAEAAETAKQNLAAAAAVRDGAKDAYDRAAQLRQAGNISEAQLEKAKADYLAAQSSAQSAEAAARRARIAAEGTSTLAQLEADLQRAEFDLDKTVVRAPTDGTVVQNFLRPGMYAVPMPLRPVMIFLHDEPPVFGAAFLQNSTQRIIQDSEAEVILPSVPGRFFRGKVKTVGAYIPQGQLQPTGTLLDPEQIRGDGRVQVIIELDEEELAPYQIIPGSTGQAAIYTEHMHHLSVMRKVLLRMKSWLNYLFSDGH
jgi:multidrug resistance efflux pump